MSREFPWFLLLVAAGYTAGVTVWEVGGAHAPIGGSSGGGRQEDLLAVQVMRAGGMEVLPGP